MASVKRFHFADYIVFVLTLFISFAIGLYYVFCGKKQKTTESYLMGDRKLQFVPVAVSTVASLISAITLLGIPSEIYLYGTQLTIHYVAGAITTFITAYTFVPLFHNLKLTSINEYLELRFHSKGLRLLGTVAGIWITLIYMAAVLYGPASALEAVTGLSMWISIVLVGFIGVLYTTMGGMRAVIWTDFFQAIIVIGGLFAILIVGASKVGGMGEVWRRSVAGRRVEFFNFNPDPTCRVTFWGAFVGGLIGWVGAYGVNQMIMQRFCAVSTLAKARASVISNAPCLIFVVTMVTLVGMVTFAYYDMIGCDPLKIGHITSSNQILPYFVLDAVGYPGIPGLFVSCVFSGSLSTVSSCLNAIAAVFWEDIIKDRVQHRMTEEKRALITKIIVFVMGIVAILFSFVFALFGSTIIHVSTILTSTMSGPLFGVFMMAMLFSFSNWKGAVAGFFSGMSLMLWLGFGQLYFTQDLWPALPTSTALCYANETSWNSTTEEVTTTHTLTTDSSPLSGLSQFYGISFVWHACIGSSVCIIVGLIVSVITGMTNPKTVPNELLLTKACLSIGKTPAEKEPTYKEIAAPEKEMITIIENGEKKKSESTNEYNHDSNVLTYSG